MPATAQESSKDPRSSRGPAEIPEQPQGCLHSRGPTEELELSPESRGLVAVPRNMLRSPRVRQGVISSWVSDPTSVPLRLLWCPAGFPHCLAVFCRSPGPLSGCPGLFAGPWPLLGCALAPSCKVTAWWGFVQLTKPGHSLSCSLCVPGLRGAGGHGAGASIFCHV